MMFNYLTHWGGLFVGIAPDAIPRGDNLMLLVSEQPLMYVYTHQP